MREDLLTYIRRHTDSVIMLIPCAITCIVYDRPITFREILAALNPSFGKIYRGRLSHICNMLNRTNCLNSMKSIAELLHSELVETRFSSPLLPTGIVNADFENYNAEIYTKLIKSIDVSCDNITTRLCTTIHRYPIFSTSYSVMFKVYTGYHGTSEIELELEIELGSCACTVDNPLAKVRGLSLRTGSQTMLYLSLPTLYISVI